MRTQATFVLLLLIATFQASCDRPATKPVPNAIVSLSPAATDLLLAMGAADRLVGVSTFDADSRVAALPKVGDYENVDWERIATLAPKHMIVQMAADRVPVGLRERAKTLGIELHVVQIDRLDDVVRQGIFLGSVIGRADEAKGLRRAIESKLAAASQRAARGPRVRTLIALSEDGLGVAGRDTHLDDALRAAGGENVLGDARPGYLKLDRELLLALAPDAIVHLAPAATPADRAAIDRAWQSMPTLPAVREKRILVIDDSWALQPGSRVGDLAERIADFLHPPP